MRRLQRALVVLVAAGALAVVARAALQVGPGPTPIRGAALEETGTRRTDVRPTPLTGFAVRPIDHPFMAFEGGGLHGNSYNSGVHVTPGPVPGPEPLELVSRSVSPFPGGLCPTITFDRDGNVVAMCASFAGFEIALFAPHTLELLASFPLPRRPSTFEALVKLDLDVIFLDTSGGSYFYLDDRDRVVLADAEQRLVRIAHRRVDGGSWSFHLEDAWDLTPHAPHDCLDVDRWFPEGECDPVTSVMPDHGGRIWWVTRRGRVGTLDPETGAVGVHHFAGEEIQNSLSADADGMYVITDHALHRMEADDRGVPTIVWTERYERSDEYRYGNINLGSGSTPTLMDDEEGRRYVAITDVGGDRTGLVVYRRERDHVGDRLVCRMPLFEEGGSAVEISPIGWGRSIVVKNDSGYRSAFHGTSEATIAGGIVRIDVREDGSGCDVVWTSPERVPAVVGKLSGNGVLYYYGFHEQADGENAWSLLGLDFETGALVFRQPVGAGRPFDVNWGSPAIARDGTLYLGILEGLLAFREAGDRS